MIDSPILKGKMTEETDGYQESASGEPAASSRRASLKHSYTIPCTTAFRDAVTTLAESRNVNVADLARSVLLVVPMASIATAEDPGNPEAWDRETVILKSGPSKGRPWRRKPRLQVRMAPGYDVLDIRKALNLALAMDKDAIQVRLETEESRRRASRELTEAREKAEQSARALVEQERQHQQAQGADTETLEELERMRAIVSALSFDPLDGGVVDRADALFVLGFPPDSFPDSRKVRGRFRMLATIYHPDGTFGSHERMAQLNAAMEMLR